PIACAFANLSKCSRGPQPRSRSLAHSRSLEPQALARSALLAAIVRLDQAAVSVFMHVRRRRVASREKTLVGVLFLELAGTLRIERLHLLELGSRQLIQ